MRISCTEISICISICILSNFKFRLKFKLQCDAQKVPKEVEAKGDGVQNQHNNHFNQF